MARPIWKGHISFGLVNIPVTLYSAEQRNELSFRLLDSANNARVRYERVNDETGEEVPWDRIVKGYEYEKDSYVIITEEDFKRAAVEATQSVDIEGFVDVNDVSPLYFDKPYILTPGKKGEKGYMLLRKTLEDTGKIGIARVVIRSRQHLAAVMPLEGALVLNLLRFADELRAIEDFDVPRGEMKEYQITKKELDMAATLVEAMSDEWQPTKYHDDYREKLEAWIEQRIEAGQFEHAPEGEWAPEAEAPAPINIMDLLKESVESATKTGDGKGRKKKAG